MALSYSGWKTHDQCPFKFKCSYKDRLPRGDGSPQMARGTDIHNSVENYLLGKAEEVHPEIVGRYGQWLMQMKELKCTPELKWGMDARWNFVDFKSELAVWRGVIDLDVGMEPEDDEVDTYEWKTGRIYPDHAYQSSLYGVVQLVRNETANVARIHNVYFDQYKTVPREYRREDLEGEQMLWNHRWEEVMNDDINPPNPGWYCRYCDFSKDSGGPCIF